MKSILSFSVLFISLLYLSQAQTNTTAILQTSRDVSFCIYGVSGIYNEVISLILLEATSSQNALVAKYFEVYRNILKMWEYLVDGEVPSAVLLGVSAWTTIKDLYSDFTLYLPECYNLVISLWGVSTQ